MKIIRAIDRFFDTFEKRLDWVFLWILGYWTWQVVWVFLLMFHLFFVKDQSQLISFMEIMGSYQSSLLVRIAFSVLNYASIFLAFSWFDVFVLVFTVFMTFVFHTKTILGLWGSLASVIVYISVFLVLGLKCTNLSDLFQIFHILSIGSLLICGFFIILSLFAIVNIVLDIGDFEKQFK